MHFKDVKELSGMNLAQFSRYFHVPYRTVQNWAAGVSKCPSYLLSLFVYKLQIENVVPPDGINGNITPAVRITIDLNEDITQSFTEMYRTLRGRDDIIQLSTCGDTAVCVICRRHAKTAILRLLRKFGDVIAADNVNVVRADKKQRYVAVINNVEEITV